MKAGETLRFVYTNLAAGAQGHLNVGWNDGTEIALPGASDYFQLRGCSYSVVLTDEMLSVLREKGLNVLGVGHTLIAVQAVDYSSLPDVEVAFDTESAKYFEGESMPKLSLTLTSNSEKEEVVDVELSACGF